MPRKASPLKDWVVYDEIPKRSVRGEVREANAELLEAFINTGEKVMATTMPEDELKRKLAQLRTALKAMPEFAEKVKVGKSGDKLFLQRTDI